MFYITQKLAHGLPNKGLNGTHLAIKLTCMQRRQPPKTMKIYTHFLFLLSKETLKIA